MSAPVASTPAFTPAPAPALSAAAARPACVLLAAYVALTLAPLARAGRTMLPAYAALLALAVWGAARSVRRSNAAEHATGTTLAAWLPLAAVPLLYATVPAVAAALAGHATPGTAPTPMHAPMHDARVIAWEQALFGRWTGATGPAASPAIALAARWPHRWLGELLHAGYLSYYLVIYLPPLLLWRARRHEAFAASVFTVLLAFVACYLVFVAFPVQGPWYSWPHPPAVPDGLARGLVERLLTAGSSRGTAFPSSHVAVSVAQTLALAQVAPRLAAPTGAATLLLALGAMYGGFHYGVDVLAGTGVGVAAGLLGPPLWRRAAASGIPR